VRLDPMIARDSPASEIRRIPKNVVFSFSFSFSPSFLEVISGEWSTPLRVCHWRTLMAEGRRDSIHFSRPKGEPEATPFAWAPLGLGRAGRYGCDEERGYKCSTAELKQRESEV